MHFNENSILSETHGLVVSGGKSSRMGMDKSKILYHGKQQQYHVYEMLAPFCERVFISCREDQVNDIEESYTTLPDQPSYQNIGPMAALLTAFHQFPYKNLLFIGCDYPFLTTEDLEHFTTFCRGKKRAVCFYNEQEDIYEPLLAWYPFTIADEMIRLYTSHQYSLQYFLRNSKAEIFYPQNKRSIISVDTKEDLLAASIFIQGG